MGQMPANRLEAYMPMGDLEKTREFNFPDIRGWKVLNTTGHKVGTVRNVFVDPNTLEPHFALLDYEKFMNFNVKDLLVPWRELQLGDGEIQTRPAEGHHPDTAMTARPMGVDASSEMSVDPELYDEDEHFAIPGRTGGFD
jgi:sporulation protein YlmC with PRC-barrel domain